MPDTTASSQPRKPRRGKPVSIRRRPRDWKRREPNPNAQHQTSPLDFVKPVFRVGLGHITLFAALGLIFIGVTAIDTAPKPSFLASAAHKQIVFALLGLIGMAIVAAPHYRRLGEFAYPVGIVVLIMLVVVLIPYMPRGFVPVRNGARRWFDLGFVMFQPSELAKILFVLCLARYLRYRENYRTIRGLLIPFVLTGIPMALVLVEPDLGTALLFPPILAAMLIAAGARIQHLLIIGLIGLVSVSAVLTVELVIFPKQNTLLKPHQKDRIVSMIAAAQGSTKHDQDTGFQAKAAQNTAGAGQFLGYGRERANTILRYNRLPEAHNDMIFAVICARWGTLGGLAVIGLYVLLVASALLVAAVHKDPYARLVIVGVTAIIFSQVVVNIGMTIGLVPITGMTLPLVSYGGSSLLVNLAMVGLVLNIAARPAKIMTRPSFEFDAASQE